MSLTRRIQRGRKGLGSKLGLSHPLAADLIARNVREEKRKKESN